MVVCAAGGSLLAASGITVGGEDFPWESGAKENDNDWQVSTRRGLTIAFEDDSQTDDAW